MPDLSARGAENPQTIRQRIEAIRERHGARLATQDDFLTYSDAVAALDLLDRCTTESIPGAFYRMVPDDPNSRTRESLRCVSWGDPAESASNFYETQRKAQEILDSPDPAPRGASDE